MLGIDLNRARKLATYNYQVGTKIDRLCLSSSFP
uniref:Uncharacterized protein n=1 Tax=Arundo donax TaxID=35708 RepID=A0A0A9FHG7_ARUDO